MLAIANVPLRYDNGRIAHALLFIGGASAEWIIAKSHRSIPQMELSINSVETRIEGYASIVKVCLIVLQLYCLPLITYC